ncbi:hypothetical protein [Pelagibaculum spongiae]|nr:hypothetical protein [Pelagibaculum spongiae]
MYLTTPQIENLEVNLIGNLSTGNINKYKAGDHICNPIYHMQHRQFFSSLCGNFSASISITFITAASYKEMPTKNILSIFFGADINKKLMISMKPFYNRNDLIIAAGIDYQTASNEERVNAMAKGKAAVMNNVWRTISGHAGLAIPQQNFVLIDDNPINRFAAMRRGFQVINPAAADYASVLSLFTSKLPATNIFSPHRDNYCDTDCPVKSVYS